MTSLTPALAVINGIPRASSLDIAKHFGKRHVDVMRAINKAITQVPEDFAQRNFAFSEYRDSTGRTLPKCDLTYDGFSFVVMGFTGKEAARWKVVYIVAFRTMAEELISQREAALPKSADPAALPSQSTPSTTEDRKPLRALVHAWAQVAGVHHAALWPQVKAHFQLSRIDDLPAEWIPDALAFVQGKIDELGKAKALPLSNVALAAAAMSHFSLPSSEMSENDIVDDARGKRLKRVLRDLHAMQEQCGGLIDEVRICLSPKGRKFFLPEKLDNTYKTLQHLNFAATAGVYMARQALISAYHIGKGIEFC